MKNPRPQPRRQRRIGVEELEARILMAAEPAALLARGADTRIDIVRLSADADGLQQITDALARHRGLDGVHIVSHGSAGQLRLGNTLVDAASLRTHAGSLAAWQGTLSAEADVLLYGCHVAAGDIGQAFVQQLAQATGADVAASTDATGKG